ncbi:MAG: 2-oxoacid:acceptor oxidoreductase subunit alpha [Bacteroidales bacterium]|jgi:2-oxoglutarate ferredoxin oxidoreductase subunit alpha|nr:2-oxoacid:acceptor oxidoreductase subunit alpha [Bacteroidales bacterium]
MRIIFNIEEAVIKFAGDSGDGMQLTGTLFSEAAARSGNDLATFPDYPAEIRAPQNTEAGVSGFQVHIGRNKIHTSGDHCNVLVAMNPASLKANLENTKRGATIIVNEDAFDRNALDKSGYTSHPLDDGSLEAYRVFKAPVSRLTREALSDTGADVKSMDKSRNMFVLGILLQLFNKSLASTLKYLDDKFGKNPQVLNNNRLALEAGYSYADNDEWLPSVFHVSPAPLDKGKYRNATGNVVTAWGFMAAAEKSGRPLFLGSYPITPATDILVELSKYRALGVKTFQAEDEIAGVCSAIGAAFTGSLAVTTTSGPGFSLKSEALGLAVITELPLVIVDVQRSGPSTGMPTKSEQSDLYQALFGRNGECPCIVIAASSPTDCFYSAYEAAKLSMEHMTPVILLSDGYIGNGSQLFKIPAVKDLPPITPPIAQAGTAEYLPYRRDPETLVRQWALPGTPGLLHRIGGLEKTDGKGSVSTDALNHEKMVQLRKEKVERVANHIAKQTVEGAPEGDLLLISWGGTYGTVRAAAEIMNKKGITTGHAHFRHIMPLPLNTAEILGKYKKRIVCELNNGQFVNYLRMTYPQFPCGQVNKVQGQPFLVEEIVQKLTDHLMNENEKN